MDIVNEFFRKHYPPDWNTAWETEYCVQSYARSYKGEAGARATIFPEMICADGLRMSVQGHFGAYSQPRDDFAEHYSEVEIMLNGGPEPEFSEYSGGGDEKTYWLYSYVPIEVVAAVIKNHGGLVDDTPSPMGTKE